VKLIEKNPARCDELSALMDDVVIINGDASDQNVLLEEGLENAGAFVALTNLDEENILLSLFAKSVGNGKLITKINRIDFGDVINHLDLDSIIYPKNITSETIIRYVRAMKNAMGSNVETFYNLIKGKVEAAEFIIREDSRIANIPLMEMQFKEGVLVAAILRDRKVIIPHGQDSIQVGDAVVIVSNHLALHDITDILK
ncbi:MAG: NAD-binding protein, partial [Oscillospiraceae bacterium]|nr:NAD-binding protein [Oscillospiraceae bacterium]